MTEAEYEKRWVDQWDSLPRWQRWIALPFIFFIAVIYLGFRMCYVTMNHLEGIKRDEPEQKGMDQ